MKARALRSAVLLDLRTIARDHVALTAIALSVIGTLAMAGVGLMPGRPGAWSRWFPFVLAMGLVAGPAAFAFLFGSLMVEEGETGVRWALAVAPIRHGELLLARTAVASAWTCAWPLASVYIMNVAWRVVELSVTEWLIVIVPLALLTPSFVLVVPTLARDKVSALAVLKALSFMSLIPLVLFWIPSHAGYRLVFLLLPTAWAVEAFRALVAGEGAAAWWAAGGTGYAVALLLIVLHSFERSVSRSSN